MTPSEVRELLSDRISAVGLSSAPGLVGRLHTYFELLKRWNSRINLTGFSLSPPTPHAIDRLLVEPLQLASIVEPPVDIWTDFGSGGGSPAIPLYLYRPAGQLWLIESRQRKAAFLREVARELKLANVHVEVTRIESITAQHQLSGLVDLVTVRAVRPSDGVFEAINVLLNPEGRAIFVGSEPPRNHPSGLRIVGRSDLATVFARKAHK
jgi:16S rRNA (guanine527-N7)-methyltransferase